MRNCLALLLLLGAVFYFTSCTNNKPSEESLKPIEKTFAGRINNRDIVTMHLTVTDSLVLGKIYLKEKATELRLKGVKREDGYVLLTKYDSNNKEAGALKGFWRDDKLNGMITNSDWEHADYFSFYPSTFSYDSTKALTNTNTQADSPTRSFQDFAGAYKVKLVPLYADDSTRLAEVRDLTMVIWKEPQGNYILEFAGDPKKYDCSLGGDMLTATQFQPKGNTGYAMRFTYKLFKDREGVLTGMLIRLKYKNKAYSYTVYAIHATLRQ